MSNNQVMISSAQVRAARGLLNWTQSELADRCNLTKATIANIEGSINIR
ncbi:helix-turn-helix domain-containing protein [Candidatus Bandiella numerosa]|nr:helix-turn-helix transcriptional regulator [Candidatus Bandiella numerosa]